MRRQAAIDIHATDVCATELELSRAALLRYRGTMAGVVRALGVYGPTVEDVVHDAFEMACRKAKDDRPDPRDEARFLSWLCALAKYAALTTRNDQARNREVASPTEDLEGVAEPVRAYIGRYDDKIAAAIVLANLSADDQMLIVEHFYQDKTVQELAAERGVPWTTMRSRLDGVIDRARVIMRDKSSRRRVAGMFLPVWLLAAMTDVRRRLVGAWANLKPMVQATSLGFVAGGALIALVCTLNGAPAAARQSSPAALSGIKVAAVNIHAAVLVVVEQQAAGFADRSAASSATAFASTNPTSALGPRGAHENRRKPANVTASKNARSPAPARAIVPWGISAILRDSRK
ncbi:MAG TPA: sigma-70 family RNA polymerase sigma factor [Polyangium sp.]|nr:sigma-70 family RNA polymerase sigma factor [Polyangium sp.]